MRQEPQIEPPEYDLRSGYQADYHPVPRGRKPWSTGDVAGAIGLSISVSGVVLFAGLFVDALGPESDDSAVSFLVTALAMAALSAAIIVVTKLPVASSLNLIALATAANVAVHITSDGGDNRLLGLPPSFIEAAILSGIPFGIAWVYITRKHRRSLRDIGFVSPNSPTAYLFAFGAWFVALIGVGLWGTLVSDIDTISPPDNTTPVLEIAGGSLFVAWLLVGLWGPATEEIFFRGFLLTSLRSRIGYLPSLLVSSGIFALFHIDPGLYVPTFLLGLAFGWVYLKTQSIWPAVFAHTLHNSLVLVAVWQDIN